MDVVAEVCALARSAGLVVAHPIELRSTHHLVVWLAPSPVVAKIATNDHARATREVLVAQALAALGAPVVPPVELGLEQPTRVGEASVTFWRHAPQDVGAGLDAAQVARSLSSLHRGLAMLGDRLSLTSYEGMVRSAVRSLEQPGFAPELDRGDRARLRDAMVDGMSRLARSSRPDHVLHGSPHSMNVLVVDGVPAFIDFETVVLGPLEWDLAHLGEEVADRYPGPVDAAVLACCRLMVSAATSTWCWEGLDRGADMRGHAEHHLDVVRSATR